MAFEFCKVGKPRKSEMWLDAFSDTQATLYTFPGCVATADLTGDGDYKLIIGDIGSGNVPSKLKIYKGTGLSSELNLQDAPTAVAPIFIDYETPRQPVLTVATSEYVYVYKNLRPFFRAVLPTLPINQVERDVWTQYENVDALYEMLANLQSSVGIGALTLKTQNLLSLPHHERNGFVETHKGTPLCRRTVITCMSTLKKSHNEDDALACLVIGTENCEIFILHPETFTPIEEAKLTLTDVPVFLSTSGLFDIDYTLTCTTRTGQLLLGRRGYVAPLMNLSKPPVGVVCLETSVVVALMDSTLNCYSDKGTRHWFVETQAPITCLHRIQLRQKNLDLVAAGLQNGAVQIYTTSGELVDSLSLPEPISVIYFGQYGRETNSLVVITQGGSLHVKILKRSADFTPQLEDKGASTTGKMVVPKKTKLFVDQTMRERENSIPMHRAFQRDAFRLKLETARNLAHVLNTKQMPVQESVKLSAEVLGLGPTFTVKIGVQNIGSTGPICDLALFFHFDDKYYDVKPPVINVPLLVPGVEIHLVAKVEAVSTSGLADVVRVIVFKKKQGQPLLVAMINMPPSEMTVL